MIKMTAGAAKSKSNGRDEQPLDTSSMKPVAADSTSEAPKMANVANVSSVAS